MRGICLGQRYLFGDVRKEISRALVPSRDLNGTGGQPGSKEGLCSV